MLDYDPPLSWWANHIHDNKGGKELECGYRESGWQTDFESDR